VKIGKPVTILAAYGKKKWLMSFNPDKTEIYVD
jgi:hypothetical protein